MSKKKVKKIKFKYEHRTKQVSDEGASKYSSKIGKKGWRTVGITARGAYYKGKREHVFFIEKTYY